MKISPDFDLMFPEIEKFEFTTYITGYWGLFQAGRVLKPLINKPYLFNFNLSLHTQQNNHDLNKKQKKNNF